MKTAPESPTSTDVLNLVREHWDAAATLATYLPVGFGAHHWRIVADGAPILFATFDAPSALRSIEQIERAYSSAAQIAETVSGVIAPIQSDSGNFIVSVAEGVLSCTHWMGGRNPAPNEVANPAHLERLLDLLEKVHAAEVPSNIPTWHPRVGADFVRQLRQSAAIPWTHGPFGEPARTSIVGALPVVEASVQEYQQLSNIALDERERWVVTHGEAHWANQFVVDDRLELLDWDTISLAPPEIDFVDLPSEVQEQIGARSNMLRMFRLEWQLMEIAEYAEWFRGVHGDADDDRAAFAKLVEELQPV